MRSLRIAGIIVLFTRKKGQLFSHFVVQEETCQFLSFSSWKSLQQNENFREKTTVEHHTKMDEEQTLERENTLIDRTGPTAGHVSPIGKGRIVSPVFAEKNDKQINSINNTSIQRLEPNT